MSKIVFLGAAAAALALAVSAQAGSFDKPCTSAAESEWLSLEQLRARVEAQGYEVKKGKIKKACGEFYVIDKSGGRSELFVDPTNGQIVGRL